MKKEMLINVSEGEECRIALLEDGKLEELYMERTSATSHVGNIYKGRVTNVEASIQAAFVDFGLGRNGFLHISDLMPTYFGRRGEDIQETVGRKMARRDRPPIQRCLRRGDEIVVQIIKEGIGTKGPTLSTYLSIAGRMLVMMPGLGQMGVSRKIEDEEERRRLRQILDSLKPPEEVGFIIRTAGIGKSKTEIQRDLTYLTRLWQNLEKKRDSGPGPMELYTEGDLVTRTVRDFFSSEIDAVVVDNKEVAKRVKEVIKLANPRTKNKVELYEDPVPLFHRYGIERDIELMYSRHVPLPSGGSLVIDSTEAVVAIDVNSGKFRDHSDAETTAFKTDMEAADEIPRQLRLRDLGGVIICDFIDLRFQRHRRELHKRLNDNFKNDRAKTKVLEMSQFGIVELTRQRMRPSLKRSIYFDCPHCKGAGLVKTPESMSLDVMRRLAIAANDQRVARVEISVCNDVAYYLQNRKRRQLAELESSTGKPVIVRVESSLGLDEMRLELFDGRDGIVIIEELSTVLDPQPHRSQLAKGQPGQRHGGRHDSRRPPASGRRLPPPPRQRSRADDEDEIDRDDVPDVEDREDRLETIDDEGPGVPVDTSVESQEVEDQAPGGDDEQPSTSRPADGDRGDNGEEGPRRRRRRRRGRRGRGRGRREGDVAGSFSGNNGGGYSDEAGQRSDDRDEEANDAGPRQEDERSFDEGHDDEDAPRQLASEELADPGNEALTEQEETGEEDRPEPGNEKFPPPREDDGDSGDRKRRRRRGGRGRRRGGGGNGGGGSVSQRPSVPLEGLPVDDDEEFAEAQPAARSKPALPAASAREQPPAPPRPRPAPVEIPRTGSTDRHLAQDEPILPQPLARPRSYADLDSIPDDLDDR